MAITDDQLSELHGWAAQLGACENRLALLGDRQAALHAVLDFAAAKGMRTDDEFDAPVTLEDLPAPEDRADLWVCLCMAFPHASADNGQLAVLFDAYLPRRSDLPIAQAKGIARAHADAERSTVAKLALSVAVFDDAADWPEAHRRSAVRAYGLALPGPKVSNG